MGKWNYSFIYRWLIIIYILIGKENQSNLQNQVCWRIGAVPSKIYLITD